MIASIRVFTTSSIETRTNGVDLGLQAVREKRLHRLEPGLDRGRRSHGVGAGGQLDAEPGSRFAVEHGGFAVILAAEYDPGYIAQAYHRAVGCRLDNDILELRN
jgi:hypothetical protein